MHVLPGRCDCHARLLQPGVLLTPWCTCPFSLACGPPDTDVIVLQMVRVETYDYHPPMPLPDPEAPEQSLGDCAICMDAITIDPALRQHMDEKSEGSGLARRTGGLLAQGARKNYSLAPCHHLFVSVDLCYRTPYLYSSILYSTQHVWNG